MTVKDMSSTSNIQMTFKQCELAGSRYNGVCMFDEAARCVDMSMSDDQYESEDIYRECDEANSMKAKMS